MADEPPIEVAEREARANASEHDQHAVCDGGGGHELTRTASEAEAVRNEIRERAGRGFARIVELDDD